MFDEFEFKYLYEVSILVSFVALGIFIGRTSRLFDPIEGMPPYIDKGILYEAEIEGIKQWCGPISPEALLICNHLQVIPIRFQNFDQPPLEQLVIKPLHVFDLREALIECKRAKNRPPA